VKLLFMQCYKTRSRWRHSLFCVHHYYHR